MSFPFELLIVVGLTLANGVFAGAEIAIIAVRATRLDELAESRSGRYLKRLRADPERFLATVQIGITVVSSTAAAFGGATLASRVAVLLVSVGVASDIAEQAALVCVVASISYLSLVLGELIPKSLGLKWSERYALLVAQPLFLLGRISSPIVWVLTASSNIVLRLFGDRTSFTESQISREELIHAIDEAKNSGQVSRRASAIAARALDMDELLAVSVMVPRAAMVCVEIPSSIDSLSELLDKVDEDRYAVCNEDQDVIGYVTARDVSRVLAGRLKSVEQAVRQAIVVPEVARATDVLEQLQAKRVPMAIVVDESGSVEGIIDIDDLAEEVVGSLLGQESWDEAPLEDGEDGSVVVSGSMRIHVANRELGLELPTGIRWTTVGGLVLARLRRFPTVDARVRLDDGVELEVVETTARNIRKVRIHRPKDDGPPL